MDEHLDNDALEFLNTVLDGYKPLGFPDLSSERIPPKNEFTLARPLPEESASIDVQFGSLGLDAAVIACLGKLLAAYCGSADVLLAIKADTQDHLYPIRVRWSRDQTWLDVVQDISRALKVSNTRCFSLETISNFLSLPGKHNPFLALCALSSSRTEAAQLESFPFTLSINPTDSMMSIVTRRSTMSHSAASLLLSQVTAIIQHVRIHPDSHISAVLRLPENLTSGFERLPREGCISAYSHLPPVNVVVDYVTRAASFHPNSIAVQWYGDISVDSTLPEPDFLTYGELQMRSNQMARWLLDKGIQIDERIAVCMQRDLTFHVAMLAIMRAGCCYVPIDPDLPLERQLFIAQDSNARFVLTTSDLAATSIFGKDAVNLDNAEHQTLIQRQSSDNLDIPIGNSLAYLLYTSGTTGTPKGCLLTHEGLSEAIWALSARAADVRMDDITAGRYLSIASVAFDVHLSEIFVPLALGMTVISAPRSRLLENLPYYIANLEITHVGIVPSLIEATMGAVQEEEESKGMKLRYIASGGEKISDSILEKWADHPKVRLANWYGPSEVTIGCCGRFMDCNTPRANIGQPFANVSAYVVDENLNILLRGGVGELIVEGPLVGRGYHGRPDLTEKVFLEWPVKGAGMWAYRTGDLVRMMSDSTLEIIGRIDTQIKLRGVRIESGGISSIIRKASPLPDGLALDVSTILAKHPSIGVEQLVSFFSWDASVSVSVRKSSLPTFAVPPQGLLETLRVACEKELASYMRPAHLIPLTFLPLSSNGKADAKALLEFFNGLDVRSLSRLTSGNSPSSGRSSPQRPLTALEEGIMAVLERHIKLQSFTSSPHTNVFELGMDSLAIIRFAADLNKALGTRFSAADIMKAPTIEAIADPKRHVTDTLRLPPSHTREFSTRWSEEVRKAYPLVSIESILPSYPVQDGVLSRSVDSLLYVQHVMLQCRGDTSMERLRDAWASLMDAHPILRTVFFFDRELVQVVLHPDDASLPWSEKIAFLGSADFSSWFLGNDAHVLSKSINEQLSVVPPFRLTSYKCRSHYFVVFSIHHALFDAISLPIMIQEVQNAYLSRLSRQPGSLLEILDYIGDTDREQARNFWLKQFQGYQWKAENFRNAPISHDASHLAVSFRTKLAALTAKASARQVTLQALLMTTFASLLASRLYNSEDVVFGVIRSGRLLPIQGVESALCPMISVLPARVDFSRSGDVLRNIQRNISDTVSFEHIPLGKIQSWIRPGEALFATLFSVSIKEENSSEIWDVVKSEPPPPDYMLSVEVVLDHHDDTLLVQAAYIEADLSEEFVRNFLNNFEGAVLDISDGIYSTSAGTQATGKPKDISNITTWQPDEVTVLDEDLCTRLCIASARFLQVDESLVTKNSSLISLGLDSIMSIGLSRYLRKHDITISPVELLKHANVAAITNFLISGRLTQEKTTESVMDRLLIESRRDIERSIDSASLKLSEIDQVELFPTTVLQAGMLSQTISSHGKLYVHSFPLRLVAGTDVDRLRTSWELATSLTSVLRASFHFLADRGLWVQAIHSANELKWTSCTYHATENGLQLALRRITSSIELHDEFSFRQPPFWIHLLEPDSHSSDREKWLVLTMHHALYDGLSVSKILEITEVLYHGHEAPQQVQFPDLLAHFLYQEREGIPFWVQRLQGVHRIALAPRIGSVEVKSHTARHDIVLDLEMVKKSCRRAGVTLQCLGQAACAKLIGVLTGCNEVVFGHVVSGRHIPGAEDAIGPILNTVPCRVVLRPDMTNEELLRSIHQSNISAMHWQHASLRSLQKELGVTSLWDTLFVFQPLQIVQLEHEPLWNFEVPSDEEAKIQYPLNVELHEGESGFHVTGACNSQFMSFHDLDGNLTRYSALLRTITEEPDSRVLKDIPQVVTTRSTESFEPHTDINGTVEDVKWGGETEIPNALLKILSGVTNVPTGCIEPRTSVAALGIDSIVAIQLVSKCRKVGLRLSASDVLESQTIADLIDRTSLFHGTDFDNVAQQISICPSEKEQQAIAARFNTAEEIESITFTSPGMKWLIGIWQRSAGSRFQHTFAYQLPDNVDSKTLQTAWMSLLQRHAILRSTFGSVQGSGEPYMVTFKLTFSFNRWSEEFVDEYHIEDAVVDRMKSLVSLPLPSNQPMTRAVLVHSLRKHYLIIHLHHFQYDAWSLQLLLDDFSRLYHGLEPSSSNDLPTFLRMCSPNLVKLESQRRYWLNALPHPFVPTVLPKIANAPSTTSSGRIVYTNPSIISEAALCEERARFLQISLEIIFLACWARIQASLISSNAATFNLWQTGRAGSMDDIEKLALPCMNVLPLHVRDIHANGTIEIARRIQEDLRARSRIAEQTDLRHVHEWIGVGAKPLSNVFVNIVKIGHDLTENPGLFRPFNVPYVIPETPPTDGNPSLDRLPITELIQDDVMIDIARMEEDTILISIESAENVLNIEGAENIARMWAVAVKKVLGLPL